MLLLNNKNKTGINDREFVGLFNNDHIHNEILYSNNNNSYETNDTNNHNNWIHFDTRDPIHKKNRDDLCTLKHIILDNINKEIIQMVR